jgi:hypothetical protein
MNIHDYVIDQGRKDWPKLLADWRTLVPGAFTLWIVNRFGDAFIVLDDGSVHMLDVGIGQLTRRADNREHFAQLLDVDGNANNWLAISLVDACVAAGMQLSPTQCYGYKVPPILGGDYRVENIEPTDMSVHYSLLADIYQQTKDLPHGTRVNVVISK